MFNERPSDSEQSELPPDLKSFELHLASQTPAAPRVDRDRLMFAAGWAAAEARLNPPAQPSAERSPAGSSWTASRFWPAAAATMTAATILLAVLVAWPTGEPQSPLADAKQTTGEQVAIEQATLQQAKVAPAPPVSPTLGVSEPVAEDMPIFLTNRDPLEAWRLSDDRTSRYLTARGFMARDASSFTDDDRWQRDAESSDLPRQKSATARDLLEELLPEIARQPKIDS